MAAFDGDPRWCVEREIADGTRIAIRPITPDDREALKHAFEELSLQTRYLRFGLASSSLSEAALTYLTSVDQKDHVALVATMTSPDLKSERGIAVARFVRKKDDPTVAEAAVVVIDAMQNKGVGRVLTEELGRAALVRGIAKLRADVLYGNATMRHILERVGARPVSSESSDGTVAYELDLAAIADRYPASRD